MELSPSWEPANCAATQELPSILWNPEDHYRVHRSPPLLSTLSHIDPIHNSLTHSLMDLSPSWEAANCAAHPIILDEIKIIADELRVWKVLEIYKNSYLRLSSRDSSMNIRIEFFLNKISTELQFLACFLKAGLLDHHAVCLYIPSHH
jgi:hypothetical protein